MANANIKMAAEVRSNSGTGDARALRRAGRLPAVIYGGGKQPIHISVDPRDIHKGIHRETYYSSLVDVELDGKLVQVLPKAVQFHPVNDLPIHADFLQVDDKTEVTVKVPVHLIGAEKSRGLKMGGSLNVVRSTVPVICKANNIPAIFEIDISGSRLGDAIKSDRIDLPASSRFAISDREFTIATIVAPRGMTAEAQREANEGSAEGEEAAADD